ncbi:hypothetical protein [Microvirga terricola]|uniref:Uncharacterized protein n=1 Tax=Microvirga terricola TaxID=2719797 RepID=A0ABX0VDR1_9HYPH|nr:hypothetical protein [Microvirga terricola]NIX77105.1 hypothetical protein [Microvirga terricola]
MAEPYSPFSKDLQDVVGQRLSMVVFVMDYWQLGFNEHHFNVYSSIAVAGPGWRVRDGEPGFRDRLCERLTYIVAAVSRCADGLTFSFDDGSLIEISMREADYVGPEAFEYRSPNSGRMYVG